VSAAGEDRERGPALLKVGSLCAWYGAAQILFGIDLEVRPGEVVGLMGRNGAGKSTTLKAIMGLVPRRRGRIVFREQDYSASAPHRIARAGVAYVPEDRRIFTDLTVGENLEVGRRRPRRDAGPAASAGTTASAIAVAFPRLAALRDRLGGQLSGGEQQMLAVARSLMAEPELILMDEPSEGVAPLVVDAMVRMIAELKSRGIAVLLSEQNIHLARQVCDRLYPIDKGEVGASVTAASLGNDLQAWFRLVER